jgi:hypothetical protein
MGREGKRERRRKDGKEGGRKEKRGGGREGGKEEEKTQALPNCYSS